MRKFRMMYDGRAYEIVAHDDHPAVVTDVETGAFVTSIWPFHEEIATEQHMTDTVTAALNDLTGQAVVKAS